MALFRFSGVEIAAGPRMDAMSRALARNWWAMAARGAIAVLFGLVALLAPFAAIGSIVLLFAAYLLVDGVFAVTAGLRAAAHHERWGLLILEGVANLLAAALAMLLPGLTVLVVVTVLGIWSLVSGGLMLGAGFGLHLDHGRWLLLLGGALSILWGALLLAAPVAGAIVLTWWLGAYALAFGVLLLALAFRLRGRARAYLVAS
jgi:uncharacterized membrane protein HdeD (DUF308 family)